MVFVVGFKVIVVVEVDVEVVVVVDVEVVVFGSFVLVLRWLLNVDGDLYVEVVVVDVEDEAL